ncbi:hypothetical protein SMSP2_02779 [Limihaloglobus sulfuriphilus]|uniref:PEP-CTERM protein-sorting domain-containing protein n=1 Tax=Limihaloglobus sulfuriphilus TaxID=1851148 RepID=A0A1Q2MI61_9BACT|nr:choice-of-anchor E domain-containing protein [Limihaloglobus sulfuriphilus]AQQ72395.1 hypothetical protein SMSP2_02779 [Limihaloglobus sulfuriphilus]
MKKALLVLTALTVCSLNAALITQTKTFSGKPNYTKYLTYDQFDDDDGTLNSIEVIFTLNVDGGILTVDNDSDNHADGTFEFGAKGVINSEDVILSSGFVHVTGELESVNSGSFSLEANEGDGTGDYSSAAPDGMSYDGEAATDSGSGLVAVGAWSMGTTGYLGTSTYDIEVDITQWQDYEGDGGIELGFTPVDADGEVTVKYDYTVPEPATAIIFAIGGMLIRRKN